MQADNPDNWRARDFIDQPAPYASEDDPWDTFPPPEQDTSRANPGSSNSDAHDVSATALSDQMDENPDGQLDDPEYWPKDGYSPEQDIESLEGLTPFRDYDQSDSPDYWSEDGYDSVTDTESLEEPIPDTDYDDDLSEKIYQPVESTDLTDVEIRLDLFLSKVALSQREDKHIREYFEEFSKARLSNWLRWLNSKSWTGETLWLFIQFHNHWESNPEWWEAIWYHPIRGWQWQIPKSSTLSRNDAYYIVHCRIDFPPDGIIDPVWFEEWEDHRLWQYDFHSFAEFAKFRSELDEVEDWRRLIEWRSAKREMELGVVWNTEKQTIQSTKRRSLLWDNHIIPYSGTNSLSRWYEIQDWYPKTEWHDNLA